jgi:hypothetical protein
VGEPCDQFLVGGQFGEHIGVELAGGSGIAQGR